MTNYNKPLPVIEKWNAPYWQAAKRHEFVAQKCRACGYVHLPPGPACTNCLSVDQEWIPVGSDAAIARGCCTNCLSVDQEWIPLSGKGTIYSFGIYHQLWHPGCKEEIPYNVALIELAEGPQIISQVVDCNNEELSCGDAVEVTFEDVTPEISLPKFRLQRPH